MRRSINSGLACAAVLAGALVAAVPGAGFGADLGRGELLYSARCVGCHDKSVHQREARKAMTIQGIRLQVQRWDAYMGGAWREAEVNDVVAYLNQRYYGFPCTPEVCPDRRTEAAGSRLAAR